MKIIVIALIALSAILLSGCSGNEPNPLVPPTPQPRPTQVAPPPAPPAGTKPAAPPAPPSGLSLEQMKQLFSSTADRGQLWRPIEGGNAWVYNDPECKGDRRVHSGTVPTGFVVDDPEEHAKTAGQQYAGCVFTVRKVA